VFDDGKSAAIDPMLSVEERVAISTWMMWMAAARVEQLTYGMGKG
jgi:hypothetical protein